MGTAFVDESRMLRAAAQDGASMGPYFLDPLRILLSDANAAEDNNGDCLRLIPETLALLARLCSLSDDELRTLAWNLEILAQCAEKRAERRDGFEMS